MSLTARRWGLTALGLLKEVIVGFDASTDAIEDKKLPALFSIATGDPAKNLYRFNKYLETNKTEFQDLLRMAPKLPAEIANSANAISFDSQAAKVLSAKLTVVQALGRPLKVGENRPGLLKRCKTALEAKGTWMALPAHLRARIDKDVKDVN